MDRVQKWSDDDDDDDEGREEGKENNNKSLSKWKIQLLSSSA